MYKAYPQDVKGKYRNIKNVVNYVLLLFYFCCSWIRWDRGELVTKQAVFMDLPARRAYFFDIEIWPSEVYYIAGILILAALGLFLFTSLFGRLWCGYTCPQTVFVELFVKVEQFFQGDRNARIKLDAQPLNQEKVIKKLLTYIAWILLSFLFAFGWVCYFYGAPELVVDLLQLQVSANGKIWLFSLTASTYLFAAILRHRVCIYICPYGRFQSAMLDLDTTVVTYHDWRGEPRHQANISDAKSLVTNYGDCINCNKCVLVCPMGIDIRNGLQMACIGCGLCIDACDSVMAKINKPKGLINYDSINSTIAKKNRVNFQKKFFRPKIVFYFFIMLISSGLLIYSIMNKSPYEMTIAKDRNALFTITPDGMVRNTFVVKILNKTLMSKNITLHIECDRPISFLIQNKMRAYDGSYHIEVPQNSQIQYKIFVKMQKYNNFDEIPINFIIKDSQGFAVEMQSIFTQQVTQ